MGDRFDYWIHGISVQVQHENRIESIFRGGAGARIRQNSGGNWFQIPIPTPTELDDDHVDYRHAYLRGEINGQATIKRVHIWHGGRPRGRIIWREDNYSLSARELNENFNLPDQRCTDPLAMSIWVDFEEGGEIWFAGAGVYFWEHT